MDLYYGSIALIFGILVGSFTNVLIYRTTLDIGVSKGRSFCPSCNHTLAWYDLIPVLSYLSLAGKCRYCKVKISARYPLVEILSGVLYLLFYLQFGLTVSTACWFVTVTCLIALSFIDLDEMIIPDRFPLIIGLMGIVMMLDSQSNLSIIDRVIGFFSVSGILFAIAFFSGGRAMGGGDIKLMAGVGLVLGYKLCLLSLFLGALCGTIYYVWLAIFKGGKLKGMIPFGPFLAMGVVIAGLCGDMMIDWYFGMFL